MVGVDFTAQRNATWLRYFSDQSLARGKVRETKLNPNSRPASDTECYLYRSVCSIALHTTSASVGARASKRSIISRAVKGTKRER